jgi:hypothetical protein
MGLAKKLLSAITLFSLLLSAVFPGGTMLAAPLSLVVQQEPFALPVRR